MRRYKRLPCGGEIWWGTKDPSKKAEILWCKEVIGLVKFIDEYSMIRYRKVQYIKRNYSAPMKGGSGIFGPRNSKKD